MNPPYNSVGMNPKTGNPAPVELVKLRDEARTNTVAFADDDTLVIPIGANERLVFQCSLYWFGNMPGLGKLTFSTPAAPLNGGYLLLDGGVAGAVPPIGFGLANGFNGGGGFYVLSGTTAVNDIEVVEIWGNYVNGVNGGQVALQWAQHAANVQPTYLMAGSTLNGWRLSP